MFISSVKPNLLSGAFNAQIDFNPNLNLLSGENGTGKTQLLASIKNKAGIDVEGGEPNNINILVFSPKRNAERKNTDQLLAEIRQKDKRLDRVVEQIRSQKLSDNTFVSYATLGELYYLAWSYAARDGGDRKQHMEQTTSEFNSVIAEIFTNLHLLTTWNATSGEPTLKVQKGNDTIDVMQLSCGEQEVLSLVLNLHVNKSEQHVILIDEPEIHLNWHLEQNLFRYLLMFSSEDGPQLIIATHSRMVFEPRWLPMTQFLSWKDDSIEVSPNPSKELRERIAGESLKLVGLGDFEIPTFFVEDQAHVEVISEIATSLRKQISITQAGNSANVKSLFKYSLSKGGWKNAFFVIDGDNEGNPFLNYSEFIHLDRYCIENRSGPQKLDSCLV